MSLPKLYKIDSKKNTREWFVEVQENFDRTYSILVTHGLKGGGQQTKTTVIKKGKSIGRANETTVEQQAYAEALSKWNKQKDKGYDETPKEVLLPMLAHVFEKHEKKLVYPCYVQPKLDGVRCLIYKDQTDNKIYSISRLGKYWTVINHIEESLVEFFSTYPEIVLDGELYTNKLTFQEIISAVKRDTPNELTNLIEFHCYDCYNSSNKNMQYKDRLQIIKNLNTEFVVPVETTLVNNKTQLLDVCNKHINNGYEGGIARNLSGPYKVNGRSYDLQKIKYFTDQEFKIVGMKKDKNDECVFSCDSGLGGTFDVKPKGTHEERYLYYNHDNVGKLLTVQYFGWTTSDPPEPRFPIGIAIREGY